MKKKNKLPQGLEEFFKWFKIRSEDHWESKKLNPEAVGLQIQQGTKWLKGLTEDQINNYEKELGFKFPEEYKTFLKHVNGTDKQTINTYGNCGEPFQYEVYYYSYPRDIDKVKEMIKWILDSFNITSKELEEKGIPHIIPIAVHRFLVVDRCETNPILSMYGDDVVPYAFSLRSFLLDDVFSIFNPEKFSVSNKYIKPDREKKEIDHIKVDFWL